MSRTVSARGRRSAAVPRLRLLVTMSAAGAMLLACGGADPDPGGDGGDPSASEGSDSGAERVIGGELIYAIPSDEVRELAYIDPQRIQGTGVHTIMGALCSTLVYQDPETGELVPGLAESWELSDDQRTWTLEIDPDAKWHDGEPVLAEDVVFTIERALGEELAPRNGLHRSLGTNIESAEVVAEKTVAIHLTEPQVNFGESVIGRTHYSIVPKHVIQEVGADAYSQNPVCSGPFKFVERVEGSHLTLERNPDFTWGPSFTETAGGPPSLERLTFKYMAEPSTRVAAYLSGQINALEAIPPADFSRIEGDETTEILRHGKSGMTAGFDFRVTNAPVDDKRVRQAISHAIDRDALNNAVWAGANEPTCHILETRTKFYNEDACVPEFDLEAAKELLDEAGWEEGAPGEPRTKDGEELVLIGVTSPEDARVLEFIQAQLAVVGIELQIEAAADAAVNERMLDPEDGWHINVGQTQGRTNEDPNLLRTAYHSDLRTPTGSWNAGQVSIPELDEVLDAGILEFDEDKRREYYYRAQEILAEEVPTVPYLSAQITVAYRDNVHGLMSDVRGSYRYFFDVWISE